MLLGCLFSTVVSLSGQVALHNFGNIQLHGDAAIGFHLDVINNGPFNQNRGLVGFYSQDKALALSGGSNPVFHDFELAVDNDFYLFNTMGITNNANFIIGDIVTERSRSDVNVNFLNDAFYTGTNARNKVDGYVAIGNKRNLRFQ